MSNHIRSVLGFGFPPISVGEAFFLPCVVV